MPKKLRITKEALAHLVETEGPEVAFRDLYLIVWQDEQTGKLAFCDGAGFCHSELAGVQTALGVCNNKLAQRPPAKGRALMLKWDINTDSINEVHEVVTDEDGGRHMKACEIQSALQTLSPRRRLSPLAQEDLPEISL